MNAILTQAACAASALCLCACNCPESASVAAESGFRKDLAAVAQVLEFRQLEAAERALPEGKGLLLNFESEVKWLTLEEAVRLDGGPQETQVYLAKLEYVSARLGTGPKAGRAEKIKGTLLLVKSDVGWIYKGLTRE